MPWNEVKPMDQRILFIADHLRHRYSFSELCSRYGISRKTGYKWLGRYRRDGVEGLAGSASPSPARVVLRRAGFNPPSVFVRRPLAG